MRSLRTRLFAGLAAIILAAGLAGGAATYEWAFEEAIEVQDAVLLQIGALVAGDRLRAVLPPQQEVDEDTRLSIEELPTGARAAAKKWGDGLQTIVDDRGSRRVLVRTRKDGSRVAVSQSTAYRDEIAGGSALRTVLPFAALFPALMLLVGLVIHFGFRPVARLAARLDTARSEHPEPLPTSGMPKELLPFIGSINRLLERLAAMLDRQRRFIADAAHELRSPITALSLQAENLGARELPPDSRERLAALRTGIRRIAHLLEQLIAMAKYDAGNAPPPPVCRLDEVAKEIVADFAGRAQDRRIDLGFERADRVPVAANRTALEVALRNLLDNALRHTPDGGKIDIAVCADGGRAVLRVGDSGPGIAASDLERVFEPFYRGHAAVGEGSGLGLPIVRRIVEGIGGTVALENAEAPGRGLRVTLTLPLAGAEAARSPSTAVP